MDPLPVHGGTSQRPLLIRRSEKVVKESFHGLLPGCELITTVSNCDSNFFRQCLAERVRRIEFVEILLQWLRGGIDPSIHETKCSGMNAVIERRVGVGVNDIFVSVFFLKIFKILESPSDASFFPRFVKVTFK